MTNSTNYLKPFFVGLFEAQGGLYFRRLKTKKTPFFRIQLPPTNDNQAMLELIDKSLKLKGFINFTKPTKRNPSKVFWQSTKRSISTALAIFEEYPALTDKTKKKFVTLTKSAGKLKNSDQDKWDLSNEKWVYPEYFGAWLSGFLENNSTFICEKGFKLEFSQQIEITLVNIIKEYFQGCPLGTKMLKNSILSNRFCLEHKKELDHMVAHFKQNPLLGDGKITYNRFLKIFNERNTRFFITQNSFINNSVQSNYLEPFFVGLFEGDPVVFT